MTDKEFADWMRDSSTLRCVCITVGVLSNGQEIYRHLSDIGYTSHASDTPPRVTFTPCVVGGLEFSAALPVDGSVSMAWGDVELANFDGEFDDWLEDVWSGRFISVKVGDATWPLSSFRQVFVGVVDDIVARSEGVLNLVIRDKSERLNTPVNDDIIGGVGTKATEPIPLCFGEAHNVTPVLYDPGALSYRVHTGPIERVIEVRDAGVPVSFTPDLLNGGFTLTRSPTGEVTASVQGSTLFGTYSDSVSDIISFICTNYGAQPLLTSELDTVGLAAFKAANPQGVGVYAQGRENLLQLCQTLAKSVGAHVVFTESGLLTLTRIDEPTSVKAEDRAVTASEVKAGGLRLTQTLKARSAVRLNFCRNWTVQSTLAAGVFAEHAGLFAQEWLIAQAKDQTTADVWRQGTTPEAEDTYLLVAGDASAEAQRRLSLWGVRRKQISLSVLQSQASVWPLGTYMLVFDDRFGMGQGAPAQLIGKRVNWVTGATNLEVLV